MGKYKILILISVCAQNSLQIVVMEFCNQTKIRKVSIQFFFITYIFLFWLTLQRPDVQNFHVDYNVVPFIEKRWKRIGNPISYRFWGRSFEWHSQNFQKMTLNPLFSQKYPKNATFAVRFFFNLNFHYVRDT